MPLRPLAAPWLAALVTAASCSLPDTEDLTITPSISASSLTLTPSAFSSKAMPQGVPAGSVTLELSLGEQAAEAADVQLQTLALLRASDRAELLPQLRVAADAPRAFRVEPGEKKQQVYPLAYDAPVAIGDLCQAGQVLYAGTVFDTKRNRPVPVEGAAFAPQGCP